MNVRIEYYGMPGEGRTLTEAKKDAGAKIERAMNANYTPKVIQWRGNMALIWMTPQGIEYSYVHENGKLGGICSVSGWEPKTVERSCRMNLAQLAADVTSDEVPAILEGDKGQIDAYWDWVAFQRAYRSSPEGDVSQKHQWACEHCMEFKQTMLKAA